MGRVLGIGVGPGDPGLLTQRAIEVLGEATLLIAPRATPESSSVALRIVRERLARECRVIEAVFPMSNDHGERQDAAIQAADRLAEEAEKGGIAVFITLGDAMLYSTWGYVLRELQLRHASIGVETVPGVPAFAAAAARLGEPLAEGSEPLLVWPKALPESMAELLDVAPNVVVLKVGRQLEQLVARAKAAGATASATRRLGMDREEASRDAAELLGGKTDYFTTAIVHRKAENERD